MFFTQANAQMTDGSTAPDFTADDINGNSHSLYADYLDKGIPVLIDISATWCGPCWTYHESHALKNVYNMYGPDASNELMVLFVEGASNTNLADLQGTGSSTTGDWITGTPYPIIDNSSLSNTFQIDYYPTIYGICPDKKIYEFGQKNPDQIKALFEEKCGSAIEGSSNNASLHDNLQIVCLSGENVTPSVEFINYGVNNLTSAKVKLYENDNAIDSADWSGNLASLAKESVEFNTINNVTSNSSYTARIVTVNNSTDTFTNGNESNLAIELATSETENTIKITIVTDNYPGETSWNLKDSDGNTIKSFGPYQAGPGSNGSGGEDANKTFEYYAALPEGTNCFELNVLDSYGDGLSTSTVQSGYAITGHNLTNTSIISVLTKPNFGTEVKEIFAITSDGNGLNMKENSPIEFGIFPNPVYNESELTISSNEYVNNVQISVYNVLGSKVLELKDVDLNKGSNTVNINCAELVRGIYTVSIESKSFIQSQNILKIE